MSCKVFFCLFVNMLETVVKQKKGDDDIELQFYLKMRSTGAQPVMHQFIFNALDLRCFVFVHQISRHKFIGSVHHWWTDGSTDQWN